MNDKQSHLTITKLNTFIVQLEQIKDKLSNLSIEADSINLNTDSLEVKLDTVNTNLNDTNSLLTDLINETHLVDLDVEDLKTKLDTLISGDLWQRETLAGKGFTSITGFTTISNALENNFMLLRNPANSGKLVRLKDFLFTIGATNAQRSVFRIYRSPVITSLGTPLTIHKILSTQPNSSVCTSYQQPTISNRGTIIAINTIDFNTLKRDLDLSRYLTPGGDILITVQANTSGLEHNVTINWLEI